MQPCNKDRKSVAARRLSRVIKTAVQATA